MNKDLSGDIKRNSEEIRMLVKEEVSDRIPMQNLQNGSLAYRMMLELVVGVLIGVGIGYGLDYFTNTFPLFLIIFSILGFLAGVRVMLQTAKQVKFSSENDSEFE